MWPVVANKLTMSQQSSLMAKEADGGQQVDHESVVFLWPMVAKRLTMSQQRALMAKEADGGQQVDHEPWCANGQW